VATDGGPRGSFIGNSFVYIQFGYYYIQRCARGFVARLIFQSIRACVVIILYIYTGINHVHKVSRAEEYPVILYVCMYVCMYVCADVCIRVCGWVCVRVHQLMSPLKGLICVRYTITLLIAARPLTA